MPIVFAECFSINGFKLKKLLYRLLHGFMFLATGWKSCGLLAYFVDVTDWAVRMGINI
jgi:hypothetical protein